MGPPDDGAVRHRTRAGAALLVALGAGAAVAATWAFSRGDAPFAALGVSAPPTAIVVAVPVVRLLVLVAGGASLGLLLGALVARPTGRGARELGAHGYRALRAAGAVAGAWAAAAALASVLTVLAGTGSGPSALARPAALLQAMAAFEEPAALLLSSACATAVAIVARTTLSWRSGVVALALAALGVLAPTVTGQVASAGAGHDIATDAAALAALASGAWLGATLLAALDPGADLPPAVRAAATRLLPLMRVAAVVTVVGTVVARAPLVRGEWFAAVYGAWSTAQVATLVAAAGLTLPRRPRPVATGALLIVAITAAAVVATEPAPAYGVRTSITQSLLGFDLPAPSLLGLLAPGRFNLLLSVVAVVLAGLYTTGWWRLRSRGDSWPRGRLVAWLAGCALLLWTVDSGLGSQSMAVFSAHMGTHMLVSMTVPVLLALGGPITLALRALPASGDGPRTWLVSLTEAPLARLLTHPLVCLAVFVGSLYGLYFSPVFEAALPYHWGHQLMTLHFLVTGYLFFWPIIGVDRGPRPLPHVARLALLLASMPFHAFFGVALLGADAVIGEQFYRQIDLPWVPDLLADQALAGGVAWAAGEVPLLIVVIALLIQWSRADAREAGRADRRGDRDDDAELAQWNAMLADLARRR